MAILICSFLILPLPMGALCTCDCISVGAHKTISLAESGIVNLKSTTEKGSLSGYVKTTGGSIIKSAKITIKRGDVQYSQYSRTDGSYKFWELDAGIYQLKAQKKGY